LFVMVMVAFAPKGMRLDAGLSVISAIFVGVFLTSMCIYSSHAVLNGKDINTLKTEMVCLDAGRGISINPEHHFYYVSTDAPGFLQICDIDHAEKQCVRKAVGPGEDYYFTSQTDSSVTITPDSGANLIIKY